MAMSVENLIGIAGGVSRLASMVRVSPPSVIGWRYRGRVPSKRISQIIEAARRLDPPVYLTPNDFFPPVEAPAPTTPEAAG